MTTGSHPALVPGDAGGSRGAPPEPRSIRATAQPDPLVYIVLVNWRAGAATLDCLAALQALRYERFRVILVENGSGDGSLDLFRTWAQARAEARSDPGFFELVDAGRCVSRQGSWLALVASDRNLGFAGGNNLGIRRALCDPEAAFVWLLNNDTLPEPGALSALVGAAMRDPAIGICGSTLVYHQPAGIVQAYGFGRLHPFGMRTTHIGAFAAFDRAGLPDGPVLRDYPHYVVGASMLLSRSCLEAVGLLWEGYFLYFEEVDLAIRARGRFRQAWAPDSIVVHREGASTAHSGVASRRGGLADFYMTRASLLFTLRHRPWYLPVMVPLVVAKCLLPALKGHGGRLKFLLDPAFWFSTGGRGAR